MDEPSITRSTMVLLTPSRPAEGVHEHSSCFAMGAPDGDLPPEGFEAGTDEERIARLVRELTEASPPDDLSEFVSPGFAAASAREPGDEDDASRFESLESRATDNPAGSDSDDFSRFESPDFARPVGPDPGRDHPLPIHADERSARLAGELAWLCRRAGISRIGELHARYPQLPDFALRLVAQKAGWRLPDGIPGRPLESGSRSSPPGPERFSPDSLDTSVPQARSSPRPLPQVGETVGDFRLIASLGRGVRGAVFLADQPSLANRPVVLKITSRDGREHLSLAQLRHPHIAPLYCVQDLAERNLRLLCMPYLGGVPLARLMSEIERIPIGLRTGRVWLDGLDRAQAEAPVAVTDQGPARQFLARASYFQSVCWIGACLADALEFAHGRDLVHLDLKPSNILLTADGIPMLLDFHLAQPPLRPEHSSHRWLGGTPHYMSPEQRLAMLEIHERQPISLVVDGRSDIYSLGLVLYQMIGGTISIGRYPMYRIRFRRRAGVPLGLADIVARCLEFDPDHRYATAAELAEDLRRHLADLPLRGVRNRSLPERLRKWGRRHPRVAVRAGRLVAFAGVLILSGWMLAGGDTMQRLRGAEALLAEGRNRMDHRDYPAAAQALDQGLGLVEDSWPSPIARPAAGSRDIRQDLKSQLARARRYQLAEELHELADRLRLLYGPDRPPSAGLRSLERRLRKTWESRGRILAELSPGLDDGSARRLRTDLLDLGILGADLRVRLAATSDEPEARREALRMLDEAERLFGPSPVLARERQTHAEALGWADVARAAARSASHLAPRTAWEHYALGRSLLAAGELRAAEAEFERATDLQPQDLWSQFSRGLCAYRLHRFETALRAFEVCVALSPDTADCYYNRGRAHAALGHDELARRDYEHAARLAPATDPASPVRGIVHRR